MSRAKRVLAAVFTSALLVGVVGSPALAVNDPLVPGDDCSESTQAVGHPAVVHQQPEGANPPFSQNNPSPVETAAQGSANSQAPCDA